MTSNEMNIKFANLIFIKKKKNKKRKIFKNSCVMYDVTMRS